MGPLLLEVYKNFLLKSQCILIPKGFSFLLLSQVLSGINEMRTYYIQDPRSRALARYMFEI